MALPLALTLLTALPSAALSRRAPSPLRATEPAAEIGPLIGPTFGNGEAGLDICAGNATLGTPSHGPYRVIQTPLSVCVCFSRESPTKYTERRLNDRTAHG
jgi:hypothetical protein